MTKLYYFTSEYVSPGHPDATSNIIADTIIDELTASDKNTRAGLEVQIAGNNISIAGEIKTTAKVNYEECAKKALNRIGFAPDYKFSGEYSIKSNDIVVRTHISSQSPDISQGVDQLSKIGAGDQGIFFGYADNLTPDFMGLEHFIARELNYKIYQEAKKSQSPFGLDIKTQITVAYQDRAMRKPVHIDSIVAAAPTLPDEDTNVMSALLKEKVLQYIHEIVNEDLSSLPHLLDNLDKTKFYVNNTGAFHYHSSVADAGVVGRKIVVFSFGGKAPVGGGAFAGKDLSKSDVSMLYLSRYLAKNIVASGIADRATIQLSSAIGYEKPLSLNIDLHETGKIDEVELGDFILNNINLSISNLVTKFACSDMASCNFFGHFGKHHQDKNWEKLDLINKFKELLR